MRYVIDESATLGMQMDALRAEMDAVSRSCCYLVNADAIDSAHEASQEYFDLLAAWTDRAHELASATHRQRGPS